MRTNPDFFEQPRDTDADAAEVRLFQDTLEVLLLATLPTVAAEQVRPHAERAWLEDLAILTGLSTATGIASSIAFETLPAALTFSPTPEGMRALRAAHVEARRELVQAKTISAMLDAKRLLILLNEIGRALRSAGLWPVYVAAARTHRTG